MVRIKERYLLVKLIYPPDLGPKGASKVSNHVVQHQPTIERLTPQILMAAIFQSVGLLFGDYGRGAVSGHASIKYLSLATSTFIMRCAREHHKMVWAALTLLRKVPVEGGRPCMFHVVRVSGTMRKVEEEAIRQARRLILAAQNDNTSAFLGAFTDDSRNEELEDITMQDGNDDSDGGVANVAG